MKDKMLERHRKMLDWQVRNHPWVPTIRDLRSAWNISSTSVVRYTLEELRQAGLVITKERGAWHHNYYAVSRGATDEQQTSK